jgi:hypothetical protein
MVSFVGTNVVIGRNSILLIPTPHHGTGKLPRRTIARRVRNLEEQFGTADGKEQIVLVAVANLSDVPDGLTADQTEMSGSQYDDSRVGKFFANRHHRTRPFITSTIAGSELHSKDS